MTVKESTETTVQWWAAQEKFKVILNFDPSRCGDSDLIRLAQDACRLLGQPVGHDYATEVLDRITEVLSLRVEERRQAMYRP